MKRLTILLTALLTAALCAAPALAANRVETLTTDVALRADGSAHVTQVFSADTAEGTEFYVDRMDSGCLTYSQFAVSDENGSYAVLPDGRWDIDASFDEKAGKCGLLEIDGGVELCWGITEYGRHDYTVSYDIGGLAGAYSDADGFNYRFIDPDQSIFPTSASVTVRMEDGTPLTDETCDIWAFGFDGQVQFEDGVIRAWTETPLEGSHYMTVMDIDEIFYCCLYGNNEDEVIIRHLYRDREYEQEMIYLEREFWHDHILTRIPPPYTEDGSLILESLRRRLGAADKTIPAIQLDSDLSAVMLRYLSLQEQRQQVETQVKTLDAEMQRLKGQMVANLGGSCMAMGEYGGTQYTISYNPVSRTGITKDNLQKLKLLHPDIYDEYVTVSESRRFSIKAKAADEAA